MFIFRKLLSAKAFTLIDVLISIQIMTLVSLFAYSALKISRYYFHEQSRRLFQSQRLASYHYLIQKSINEASDFENTGKELRIFKHREELLRFTKKVFYRNKILDDSLIVINYSPNIQLRYKSERLVFSLD